MNYQILPVDSLWSQGIFCVPQMIVTQYMKMASENQIKVLLVILSSSGISDSETIAKKIGATVSEVDESMSYWIGEGVLINSDNPTKPIAKQAVNLVQAPATPEITPQDTTDTSLTKYENSGNSIVPVAPNFIPRFISKDITKEFTQNNLTQQPTKKPQETASSEPSQTKKQSMPLPTLTPKDIVQMCFENQELTDLMQNAQEVLGRTLSHCEQELLVNMVVYYGLPVAVVLTILHYYKTEKESGKAIGTAYISAMAKNWSEEGIVTLQAADEKLKSLEVTNKLWSEIISLTGIRHRNPTIKQRDMVKNWSDNFSMEMIGIACDIMKEKADKPSLNYVDKVLNNWLKKNIKTPSDVTAEQENFNSAKTKSNSSAIDTKPTYDIDEITKNAMFNDNIDI